MASKIIKIMLMLLAITYFFGCVFIFLTKEEDDHGILKNWYKEFGFAEKTLFAKFVTSMYFNLTLLSSVGYGDLYPINEVEMIYIVCE